MARHITIVDLTNRNKGCGRHCCLELFKDICQNAALVRISEKKTLIVVNFDVDISHVVTHSHLAGHGNVSPNKSADG